MQAIASTLPKSSETATRSQNGDVLLRNRVAERPQREATGRRPGSADGVENVPSTYLLLISRVENMLHRGGPEAADVEQLSRLLSERLGAMSPVRRREVESLEAFQALGLDAAGQIPPLLRHQLATAGDMDALLALLKSPAFVAAIRDEARTHTYGPRGLLRAS